MTTIEAQGGPAATGVARSRFLEAMRRAATGVTVVATDGPAGKQGCTVSAMSSVSADPPTLLVCIHRHSRVADAIVGNAAFAVSLLGVGHRQVSEVFAGRVLTEVGSKFVCGFWERLATGAPVLRDAPAAFDCRLVETVAVGSHLALIGRVVDTATASGRAAAPLVYSDRDYHALEALR